MGKKQVDTKIFNNIMFNELKKETQFAEMEKRKAEQERINGEIEKSRARQIQAKILKIKEREQQKN